MRPEFAAGGPGSRPGWGRPAQRMPFAAVVALFATTAVAWMVATQPADARRVWRLGPAAGLTGEQWAVLVSSVLGVLVLFAGLFAIVVYVFHRTAAANREVREMIALARAELQDLQQAKDEVAGKVDSLERLRAEIALLEAELLRAQEDSAREAGRVVTSGLEVMDDVIAELRDAAARDAPDRPDRNPRT